MAISPRLALRVEELTHPAAQTKVATKAATVVSVTSKVMIGLGIVAAIGGFAAALLPGTTLLERLIGH